MSPMVSGSLVSEAPVQELEDTDEDHLVCGCRAHITMCGIYVPDSEEAEFLPDGAQVCPACEQVWDSIGCGICGCCSTWSCGPCQRRYFKYLQSAAD